jgi:hypothetical protein
MLTEVKEGVNSKCKMKDISRKEAEKAKLCKGSIHR